MKYNIRQIEAFAGKLSPDVRRRKMEADHNRIRAEYDRFQKAYREGNCYLCDLPLNQANTRKLCPHWLLQPQGIKTRDIGQVLAKFGYFRTQAFLRWLANQEGFARNINDLDGERDPSKVMEATIAFRDFEWTFTCAQSDLDGHSTSANAEAPHFHFQMKRGTQIIFGFSGLHCPFTDHDLFKVEIIRSGSSKIGHHFPHGQGMNDLLHPKMTEALIEQARTPPTPDQATIRLQTIVMPMDGKFVVPEELSAILREAQEKDVPFASLVRRLKDKAKIMTVIVPAATVPNITHRKKSRGNKKSK